MGAEQSQKQVAGKDVVASATVSTTDVSPVNQGDAVEKASRQAAFLAEMAKNPFNPATLIQLSADVSSSPDFRSSVKDTLVLRDSDFQ